MKLTGVQKQLLTEVQNRGGKIQSLFRLVTEIEINYHHAWDCLTVLEDLGLIVVIRRRGYPLVVIMNPCSEHIPPVARPEYAPSGASRPSVFEKSRDTGHRTQEKLWTM